MKKRALNFYNNKDHFNRGGLRFFAVGGSWNLYPNVHFNDSVTNRSLFLRRWNGNAPAKVRGVHLYNFLSIIYVLLCFHAQSVMHSRKIYRVRPNALQIPRHRSRTLGNLCIRFTHMQYGASIAYKPFCNHFKYNEGPISAVVSNFKTTKRFWQFF